MPINKVTPVNPVAKYSRKYNKAQVHKDKKKEQKKRGPPVDKQEDLR